MSIEDRNLKPGTVLVADYPKRGPKRKSHRCEVRAGEEGKLVYRYGGKDYTSPSAAGTAALNGQACNGWRFWTVEGTEPATKATSTRTTAKKAAAKAKPARKAKAKPKSKAPRKVAGGANGEPSVNGTEPVEKPVSCGDCGAEFPTSREAANHMRDAHGSVEAPGNGA